MASRTVARLTDRGPLVPARGTLSAAANSLYPKGCLVGRDINGRAYAYTTADASGNPAMGIASATFDNRTGSEMGGLDDSGVIEVEYGVFGFDISGTTPIPGDTLYAVDNQSVSIDSAGGTRGIAGVCSEVRTGAPGTSQAYITVRPSSVASAGGDRNVIPIDLGDLRLSTGAAVPAFNDGVADGFELTDSEAVTLRINPGSTTKFVVAVPLVEHDGGDLVLKMHGFRVGAADPTAAVTVEAFFQTLGAAHTADADAGGDTSAFDAATTIVDEVSLTIDAADVPASPCVLSLTFQVTAALDADDLCILAVWLEANKAA